MRTRLATLGTAMIAASIAATMAALLALPLAGAALNAQQQGVDVTQYRYQLTLPDTGKRIRVRAEIEFQRAEEVRTLRLDLLAPMRVLRTMSTCGANAPRISRVAHDSGVVRIPLPAGAAGRTECVAVEYEGSPADGLVITVDSAGRWRAFGDNWPNRARHWLASVDHPSDKALVEFVVDAPVERRVVANGTERSVRDVPRRAGSPTRRVSTWATVAPIPTYLMVIAAAPLEAYDLGQTACGLGGVERCVRQQVFTAPEQAHYMPGNFRLADDIVRYFARTVGPFPFEQLAHLQSSTRFGGMENAGAIFYADRLFRRANGVGVGLIAHETAHQWFGDAVTEREWGHVWLSEGFATYFASLYTQYATGDSAFRAELAGTRRQIVGAAVVKERPVLDTAQSDLMALLNTNSYQKGGWVLHMLRGEVGDSAFFRGIRKYWTAHRHGTAMTADLRAAVESEAGRDLGWFFDQWLTRPGFAEVTTSFTHDAATGQVSLTVVQGAQFAPYRFPLRVAVEGADGVITLERIEVPASAATTLALTGRWPVAPRAVRADPNVELLADIRTP